MQLRESAQTVSPSNVYITRHTHDSKKQTNRTTLLPGVYTTHKARLCAQALAGFLPSELSFKIPIAHRLGDSSRGLEVIYSCFVGMIYPYLVGLIDILCLESVNVDAVKAVL